MNEPVGPTIARDGLDAFVERFEVQAKLTVGGILPSGITRVPLFEITRLNTVAALYAEGDQMDHCVGGYAPLLARPGHYFFSIRFKLGARWGSRSTLHADATSGAVNWQHLSYGNTAPRLMNVVACDVVVERLRAVHAGRKPKAWAVAGSVLSRELRRRWAQLIARQSMRDWKPEPNMNFRGP